MNDKGVCRTAPATPGLVIRRTKTAILGEYNTLNHCHPPVPPRVAVGGGTWVRELYMSFIKLLIFGCLAILLRPDRNFVVEED